MPSIARVEQPKRKQRNSACLSPASSGSSSHKRRSTIHGLSDNTEQRVRSNQPRRVTVGSLVTHASECDSISDVTNPSDASSRVAPLLLESSIKRSSHKDEKKCDCVNWDGTVWCERDKPIKEGTYQWAESQQRLTPGQNEREISVTVSRAGDVGVDVLETKRTTIVIPATRLTTNNGEKSIMGRDKGFMGMGQGIVGHHGGCQGNKGMKDPGLQENKEVGNVKLDNEKTASRKMMKKLLLYSYNISDK